jgi:CrcB protein
MEFAPSVLQRTNDSWPLAGVQESFFARTGSARKDGEKVQIFLLVVFGAAGTLARYGLQGLVQYRTATTFPSGTLAVNLAGCFLLGSFAQFSFHHMSLPPEWRIAITVGFFGAFTTFSSFGWETVRMLEDGAWMQAGLYLVLSVVGGLLAAAVGMRIVNAF